MVERLPTIGHLLIRSDMGEACKLAVQLASQSRSRYHHSFIFIDPLETASEGPPPPTAEELGLEQVNTYSVHCRSGLDWQCSRQLERVLRREKVDLLHAHQADAFLHGMIARLFYRRPPVLFSAYNRRFSESHSIEQVVMERMLLESRDQIVAASRFIRRSLILDEGLPPERVEVIYNALTPPTSTAWNAPTLRWEIGVDRDAFLLLQVARFEPSQNHAIAIRALKHLVRKIPEICLALVGDGPELETVRGMVRQWGLERHVRFLGPRGDYERLLAAADLVLLTGFCEVLPAVLIQALFAGRPVVAARAGCIPELLENQVCGLLARPGDAAGLARRIHRLYASEELRERLGRQGRERIEALCSAANTSTLYFNKYHSMIGR
jgi:glycosyltransferase involved in cell wall biosynthesis